MTSFPWCPPPLFQESCKLVNTEPFSHQPSQPSQHHWMPVHFSARPCLREKPKGPGGGPRLCRTFTPCQHVEEGDTPGAETQVSAVTRDNTGPPRAQNPQNSRLSRPVWASTSHPEVLWLRWPAPSLLCHPWRPLSVDDHETASHAPGGASSHATWPRHL